MRIAILAPTDFSLFARVIARFAIDEPGLSLMAVAVRRVASVRRVVHELERDGVRVVRKAWRKAVLGGEDAADTGHLLAHARARGVSDAGLQAMCAAVGVDAVVVEDLGAPESLALLSKAMPDVVVFAGGGILRAPILDIAPHGILNAHMGILPRYRGMDVVEWALLEGRPNEVGITVHRMDAGVDTGPILRTRVVGREPGERIARLRSRMEVVMVEEMSATLRELRDGTARPIAQASSAGRQYFVIHPRLARRLA